MKVERYTNFPDRAPSTVKEVSSIDDLFNLWWIRQWKKLDDFAYFQVLDVSRKLKGIQYERDVPYQLLAFLSDGKIWYPVAFIYGEDRKILESNVNFVKQ